MENGLPELKSGLSLHFFQELGLCSMLVYLLKESTAKKKNEGAEKLKTKNERRQGLQQLFLLCPISFPLHKKHLNYELCAKYTQQQQ